MINELKLLDVQTKTLNSFGIIIRVYLLECHLTYLSYETIYLKEIYIKGI